jgi:diguanylate cyclase
MSVLMIDIDFFKELNDSFGHDFGDAALVQVAAILRNEALEEGFIVGRQGGDEFVALLPGVSGPKAAAIAERIRRACSETLVEHGGKSAYVTVSVGVSTQSQQNSLSQLIGEADGALYCAKQEGRNRVVLYRSVVSLARVA